MSRDIRTLVVFFFSLCHSFSRFQEFGVILGWDGFLNGSNLSGFLLLSFTAKMKIVKDSL